MFERKLENNWIKFSLSYLNIAKIACLEMAQHKYDSELTIDALYIATVYNVKHAIEAVIKSIIVLLEKDELGNDKYTHNIMSSLEHLAKLAESKNLKKIIEEEAEKHKGDNKFLFLNKKVKDYPNIIIDIVKIVSKYYRCSFLKDKISSDFEIEDFDNTAFRYPQNNLKIKLDYPKICARITEVDIFKMYRDILKLENALYSLWFIFSAYVNKDL